MIEFDNGGPAFPQSKGAGDLWIAEGGLSIRDYFAAKAMQGIAAAFNPDHANFLVARDVAVEAYEIADAMLAARSA